jgi:hypothetical protein
MPKQDQQTVRVVLSDYTREERYADAHAEVVGEGDLLIIDADGRTIGRYQRGCWLRYRTDDGESGALISEP